MKLAWLLLSYFVLSIGYAKEASLPLQIYQHHPCVKAVDPSTITLSDGTVWKTDSSRNMIEEWQVGELLFVRWDNTRSTYVLQSIANAQKKTEAVLATPSQIRILAVDSNTLTLSDGSSFSYIPFIDVVYAGDYVLLSLNENKPSKEYPYFIVGYSKKNSEWKVTGEVQARLKHGANG